MKKTHESAIRLFNQRKYIDSFNLANKDEGLIKPFTFEEWLDYAHKITVQRNREKIAYKENII